MHRTDAGGRCIFLYFHIFTLCCFCFLFFFSLLILAPAALNIFSPRRFLYHTEKIYYICQNRNRIKQKKIFISRKPVICRIGIACWRYLHPSSLSDFINIVMIGTKYTVLIYKYKKKYILTPPWKTKKVRAPKPSTNLEKNSALFYLEIYKYNLMMVTPLF